MKAHVSILLSLVLFLSVAWGGWAPPAPNDPSPHAPGPLRVAEAPAAPGRERPAGRRAGSDAATPEPVVTEHTILVNGQSLHYRATAGYLPVEGPDDQVVANLFFVAYERLDQGQRAESGIQPAASFSIAGPASSVVPERPIVFAFNGGPGASSVWLHLGALGPKRAVLAHNGTALPDSDQIVDNDSTWLTFADLVFVDPIGTGFSRAAPGIDASRFYTAEKDIEVAADFVRLYATKYGRWLSPQFLVGESYGTTRVVGMTRRLQHRYGLYVRGLVLLSAALDLQAISFDPGNDLPYVLAVPSYAAVALYHDRLHRPLSADLDRSLQKVKTWALHDYLDALAQGAALGPTESQAVARTLAEFTGLPEDLIARSRLRISNFTFIQELLSGENRVLGLLDGRVTAPRVVERRAWTDPSLFIVQGPFVAAFNDYVRADLGFRTDRPYIFLSDQINESWDWGAARQGYLNVAPILAEGMGLDDRLHVFGGAGYYDLTTPFLSQEYVYNHLGLPAGLWGNLTLHRYYSGHQIYTVPAARRQLTADVRAFIASSSLSQ